MQPIEFGFGIHHFQVGHSSQSIISLSEAASGVKFDFELMSRSHFDFHESMWLI